MAHVGKFYKLQFRRDLNFAPPNVQGWPEAATWNIDAGVGVMAAALRAVPVPCFNLLKTNQPPMVWTSAARPFATFHYKYIVSISNPQDLSLTEIRFQVQRQEDGVILFDLTDPGHHPTGLPSQLFWGSNIGGSFVAPWYGPGSGQTAVFEAMGWGAYNP
jgi:hypothetical protein